MNLDFAIIDIIRPVYVLSLLWQMPALLKEVMASYITDNTNFDPQMIQANRENI